MYHQEIAHIVAAVIVFNNVANVMSFRLQYQPPITRLLDIDSGS